MATKNLNIKVTTEGVEKSAQQAKGLTASYNKVAGAIAKMAAGYIAVTKSAALFSKTIKAAAEQETIFKKLETSVNLLGVSYDKTAGSLNRYFAELQATTQYGDTDMATALTQMIQLSGNFDGSVKALTTTLDLGASGLFDLQTAARFMGMALAGNVEMLGRYIPELKSTVTPQLKLMSAAEKTAFAMDLLNQKFGGSAVANLQTYNAQLQQTANYYEDLTELVGDYWLPLLTKVSKALLDISGENFSLDKKRAEFRAEIIKLSDEEVTAEQKKLKTLILENDQYIKLGVSTDAIKQSLLDHTDELEWQLAVVNKINEARMSAAAPNFSQPITATDELSIDENEIIPILDRLPELTEEQLAKIDELRLQHYMATTDTLQQQQDTEEEMWLNFYNNLLINDEDFESKKAEIKNKYSELRSKIAERESIREAQAVGRLVGSLANLAEAMGANAATLKVMKSGEAIINTYAGAARALADYPAPASYIVAAATIANGLASVAKINATGFQFGTEGYTVPAGNPNDSYMFAAKSGENIQVTPAGKESNSSSSELIAEVKALRDALAAQPKYIIRTIDNIQISEMAESGNYARAAV